MIKPLKKLLAVFLVAALTVGVLPMSVLAAESTSGDATVLKNSFIRVSVNNKTGRFNIRTVDGQPVRKNDQDANMTFNGDDTSFTTFRINGTDYIFGNTYRLSQLGIASSMTNPVTVNNQDGSQEVRTTWSIEGVSITQVIKLYNEQTDLKNAGNVLVEYDVQNNSGASVQMGTRVLLDTMVGSNDGPAFQNGTVSENVQTTERTYVKNLQVGDVVDGTEITDANIHYYEMGSYWVMKDVRDPSNPLATNVYAYGFNNFSDSNNVVNKIVVGHWNHLANSKFDVDVDPNLDFTSDTNDYGTADSAVAFYWNNQTITDKGSKTYQVIYGLGEIINSNSVFSLQFMDQVDQLQTNDAQTAYLGDGVFQITVQAENLASYNMYHTSATCTLTLESGLDFVETSNGKVVYENGAPKLTSDGRIQKKTDTKSLTAEEIQQRAAEIEKTGSSNIGKIAPGDIFTFTFTVMATGKAWPTTREYMAEVTSPELDKEYAAATASDTDDTTKNDIKALYQCSKSDFVFLPAIGTAQQTYAYAMTPGEVYSSDEKIINVNLSNIEAYSIGTKDTNGDYVSDTNNFDVYLVNVLTGGRYKVDVQSSVLLIGSGDGSTGDMRISYRGGTRVDEDGAVLDASMADDPTLPLGAYAVQVDFRGMTGMTDEDAELFDFTTEQTFQVTNNAETRIRTAGYLVIGKKIVTMSDAAYSKYFGIVTVLNQTAEALDQTYEEYEPKKNYKEVPVYEYKLFDTEEEIDEYRNEINEYTDDDDDFEYDPQMDWTHGEVLVTIEGMVKEQDGNIYVDTDTEPAIINGCVAYSGKDLAVTELSGVSGMIGSTSTFSGMLEKGLEKVGLKFNGDGGIDSWTDSKTGFHFGGISVSGDGSLSVASSGKSGFKFHNGKWSLDFYNGFDKSLWLYNTIPDEDEDEEEPEEGEEENEVENGLIDWAAGSLSDMLNPLKAITLPEVYFNRKSLFSTPSFNVAGFGLSFNEFILSQSDGDNLVSFGGSISLKIVNADVKNVFFDPKGFYGIESELGFQLDKSIGLLGKKANSASGTITIDHYRDGIEKESVYGIEFEAELKKKLGVSCELQFKKVKDGRILPDVIVLGADLPDPGILFYAETYITSIRGGLRELADTIAGGNSTIPLTLEAGVGVKFGEEPAEFDGNVDMTLKMSGITLEGDLNFSGHEMLTYAMIQAQWSDPWFIRAEANVDVFGWDIIVGEARIFIGQNTKRNRVDFQGYMSAGLQIPNKVRIVGGMSLGGVCMGIDNDKIYGSRSIGVGFVSVNLTVTYYWSGGLKIDTDSQPDDEAYAYLLVTDEKTGDQRLIGIGSGVKTVAVSNPDSESAQQKVIYHDMEDGVQLLEYTSNSDSADGIQVSDFGKTHSIPVNDVFSANQPADALIQVEYFGDKAPALTLADGDGNPLKIKYYDVTGSETTARKEDGTVCAFYQNTDVDGATQKYAYIVVPYEMLEASGGNWTLASDQTIETKLLSMPRAASIQSVEMTDNGDDSITAAVAADYVSAGDTVNLCLTKEPESNDTNYVDDGNGGSIAITETTDPGVKIASYQITDSDLSGTSAMITKEIDLTSCDILGEVSDVRSLLETGDYYLRAELVSGSTYSAAMDSQHTVHLTDPYAPCAVDGVTVKSAGNGYFDVSFAPVSGTTNNGGTADELGYCLDIYRYDDDGELVLYGNLNGIVLTGDELEESYRDGDHYTVPIGGWTETDDGFIGLETGNSYVVRVRAVNIGSDDSYHYSSGKDSEETLLPIPKKPEITVGTTAADATVTEPTSDDTAYHITTNAASPTLTAKADQSNVRIETFCGDKSYGTFENGSLALTDFAADGTYCLELRATNTQTGDYSVTIVYLTVDTIAPFLYIESPQTGDRTESGKIRVTGITAGGGDTVMTAYVDGAAEGTRVSVDANGSFDGFVPVATDKATAGIRLVAMDPAGNQNSAVIDVTNGDYKVPQSITLRSISSLKPGETAKLQVCTRYANGKDAEGNTVYKESTVTGDDLKNLSFEPYLGDAVNVASDGTVTAVGEGASVVKASYTAADGADLETMLMIRVTGTSSGGNDNPGDTPGDNPGSSAGGNGAGGGAVAGDSGAENLTEKDSQTKVNGTGVSASLADGILTTTVGGDMVSGGGVEILSEYKDVDGYEFVVEPAAASKLASGGVMTVETPLGTVHIPSKAADRGGFTVRLTENGSGTTNVPAVADGTDATVLGGGAGVTVAIDGAVVSASDGMYASIPVPASVNLSDLTAVVLVSQDGSWTPVTWKVDMVGNTAYADIANLAEGTVEFMECRANFSDVPDGHWARDDIGAAASKLFILGVGGDRFNYAGDVTRAGFATILLRVGGYMTMDTEGMELSDVSRDDWSYTPLAIGRDTGLITGYQDGAMHGSDSVTRGQAMTMVGRLLRLTGGITPLTEAETADYLSTYEDAAALPDWAKSDAALCVKYGIILGDGGKLNFTSNLTRAQCAAIANRLNQALTDKLLP
jgi:hypothetical protein